MSWPPGQYTAGGQGSNPNQFTYQQFQLQPSQALPVTVSGGLPAAHLSTNVTPPQPPMQPAASPGAHSMRFVNLGFNNTHISIPTTGAVAVLNRIFI